MQHSWAESSFFNRLGPPAGCLQAVQCADIEKVLLFYSMSRSNASHLFALSFLGDEFGGLKVLMTDCGVFTWKLGVICTRSVISPASPPETECCVLPDR